MVVFQAAGFSDDEEDTILYSRAISSQLAARLGPSIDLNASLSSSINSPRRPGFQPLARPRATMVTPSKTPIFLRLGPLTTGRNRGYRVPESDDSDSSANEEPNDTFLHRVASIRRRNPPPKQRLREEIIARTPKGNSKLWFTPASAERTRTPKVISEMDIAPSPSRLKKSSWQFNAAKTLRNNTPSKPNTTAVRATALGDVWDHRSVLMKSSAWLAASRKGEELERVRESARTQKTQQWQLKLKLEKQTDVRIEQIYLLNSEKDKEIAQRDAEAISKNESMKKRHDALYAEMRDAKEKKAMEETKQEEARVALEISQKKAKEDAEKDAIDKANQALAEKAKQELQQKEHALKAEEEQRNKSKQMEKEFVSPTALADAEVYRAKLKHLKENVLPSSKRDKPMKDYCFKTKREITKRISQLTNYRREVLRICTEIDTIFRDAQSKHVIVYEWLMNLAAKSVVSQAEKEVSVRTGAAFPLARVCVYLMQKHPEFKLILLARMIKRSPYIVPQYAMKQSDAEAFFKARGYKKNSDGMVEQDGAFVERQCGIISLYAAITQTIPSGGAHPHGLECAWRWIARFVNMKPRETCAPALLLAFLDVTAPRLLQAYGSQFVKILVCINGQYVKNCPEIAAAHVSRLTSKLGQFARTSRWEEIKETQYDS